MGLIVRFNKSSWITNADSGTTIFIEPGIYRVYHKDNIHVYFYLGRDRFYTDIGNSAIEYIGPDTQKANIMGVENQIIGKVCKIHIENTSKLNTTLKLILRKGEQVRQEEVGTIVDGGSFTIPLVWIEDITDSDKTRVELILTSFKEDGSYFGEDSLYIDAYVPSDIVPNITSISLKPDSERNIDKHYGYLSEVGRLKAEINASGVHGSKISSVKIYIDGEPYVDTITQTDKGYIITSKNFEKVGNVSVKLVVEDTRGRIAEHETKIKLEPYFLPYIEGARLIRANEEGEIINEGRYCKIEGAIHIAPRFTLTIKLYRDGKLCDGADRLWQSFEIEKSYDLLLVISDGYYESKYNLVLDSAYCLMNVKKDAFAIGGYAKESGFEVFMPLASNITQSIEDIIVKNAKLADMTSDIEALKQAKDFMNLKPKNDIDLHKLSPQGYKIKLRVIEIEKLPDTNGEILKYLPFVEHYILNVRGLAYRGNAEILALPHRYKGTWDINVVPFWSEGKGGIRIYNTYGRSNFSAILFVEYC